MICKMIFKAIERYRSSKNFFTLNLKYLFVVGLWPEDLNQNQQFLYKMYQNTLNCLALIYLIITGYQTYKIKSDLILFLSNIDKTIVAYNFLLKALIFYGRREEIKKIIDDILLSGDTIREDTKNNMFKHLVVITAFNSGLMLFFNLLGYYNGEMAVEAWMPFDAKKILTNLVLSSQILAILFCIPFSYRSIAAQGMVCSILIYICDQLVALQDAIENLDYSNEKKKEAKENLRKIIMKHIRLMGYSKSMETALKEYFFVQNLAITLELCLNAMVVTVVGMKEKFVIAVFAAFLGLALLNAFIYCYLGNELIDQSEAVAFAAYSSNWYTWPPSMRKDILLIMRAAQRPFQMSAGGIAVISMQNYGTALYNGYSIFAVLNDVVEK